MLRGEGMNYDDFFNQFVKFTTSVHQVKNELTKNVKPSTISQVQYNMLEFIAVNQPVTASEINDCLNMTISNTSRELSKLDEKNLIVKINDDKDKRKQQIHLSKEGEAFIKEIFRTIESRFFNRVQDMSTENSKEMEEAMDFLQKKLFFPKYK